MTDIIDVRHITVKLGSHQVFSDFSFSVQPGEKIAIRGDSGKGKSTLLQVLLGFIPVDKGDINIFGQELNPHNLPNIRQKTAWVPQEYAVANEQVDSFIRSMFEFRHNRKLFPSDDHIREVLGDLGLADKIIQQSFDSLSGGQKQRVLLGVCLLMKRSLVLLDEPTSALDQNAVNKVIDYCFGLKDTTIVAATHDPRWIEHCDKVIEI